MPKPSNNAPIKESTSSTRAFFLGVTARVKNSAMNTSPVSNSATVRKPYRWGSTGLVYGICYSIERHIERKRESIRARVRSSKRIIQSGWARTISIGNLFLVTDTELTRSESGAHVVGVVDTNPRSLTYFSDDVGGS